VFVVGGNGCLLAEATTDRAGVARLAWGSPAQARYILAEADGFFLAGERAHAGTARYELVVQVYYAVERVWPRPSYPTAFVRTATPPRSVPKARVFVLDVNGCGLGFAWTNRQGMAEIRELQAGTPRYVLANAEGYLLSGDRWKGAAYYDLDLIKSPGSDR